MIGSQEVHSMDIAVGSFSVWAFITDSAPTVLILLTIAWTLVRIYETKTVQKLLGRKKDGEET